MTSDNIFRILLSYHYYKTQDLAKVVERYFNNERPEIFLDSGGFSAATQGAHISLEEYTSYINRNKQFITTYANLDVIGNAEKTWQNQLHMERNGLNPVPVFHVNEDWSYLERYVERYQYIALGGMVPYLRTPKRIMPWLIKAFKIANGRSVFHGFGATAWTVVKSLPWYSVDSSSWGSGFRYGAVMVFDERNGRFAKCKLGDKRQVYAIAPLFRRLGYDPAMFADRKQFDRATACGLAAKSFKLAEGWLRRRHGAVVMPKTKQNGLKLFLADGSLQNLADGASGCKLYLADSGSTKDLRDAYAHTTQGARQ